MAEHYKKLNALDKMRSDPRSVIAREIDRHSLTRLVNGDLREIGTAILRGELVELSLFTADGREPWAVINTPQLFQYRKECYRVRPNYQTNEELLAILNASEADEMYDLP